MVIGLKQLRFAQIQSNSRLMWNIKILNSKELTNVCLKIYSSKNISKCLKPFCQTYFEIDHVYLIE